jgi:hypothetical protein
MPLYTNKQVNKMNTVTQIEELITVAKLDLNTFNTKHTASSGTRARSSFLAIKKLCDVARKEILAETKATKAKKTAKKVLPAVEEVVVAEV